MPTRAYYRKHAERLKAEARAWYRANTERARAANAAWAEANPERMNASRQKWIEANPEKHAAHWKANQALSIGRIERRTECERCGSTERVQKHHADYSRPLDVEWLCTRCHGLEHRRYE